MSAESLMKTVLRLNTSVEALAALGAELSLRQNAADGDPRVRARIQQVVQSLDPMLLDGADATQMAVALGGIQSFFRQAIDLLENPTRGPGWAFDSTVLQAQGRLSRVVVHEIENSSDGSRSTPVSRPSSIFMTIMPVLPSPAMIAR